MQRTKVISIIRALRLELNESFKDINAGGCGIAAIAFHDAFKQHGIEVEIVVYDNHYGHDCPVNERWSHSLNTLSDYRSVPNNHILVRLPAFDIMFDSDGLSKDRICFERLQPELLRASVYDRGFWNPHFYGRNKARGDYETVAHDLITMVHQIVTRFV